MPQDHVTSSFSDAEPVSKKWVFNEFPFLSKIFHPTHRDFIDSGILPEEDVVLDRVVDRISGLAHQGMKSGMTWDILGDAGLEFGGYFLQDEHTRLVLGVLFQGLPIDGGMIRGLLKRGVLNLQSDSVYRLEWFNLFPEEVKVIRVRLRYLAEYDASRMMLMTDETVNLAALATQTLKFIKLETDLLYCSDVNESAFSRV